MIAALMVYTCLISVLFGLTALALERVFARYRWPRRGLWTLSLVASLAFSAMNVLTAHDSAKDWSVVPVNMPRQIPEDFPATAAVAPPGPPLESTARRYDAAAKVPNNWRPGPHAMSFDNVLELLWLSSSGVMLCLYLLAWLKLHQTTRCWPAALLEGVLVRVAENTAPAVFGCWRPQIVVPRWILSAPSDVRSMVLTHEREHIAARDPLLLHGALLLVILAPWNLPLWWQLRRLRFALEVDCDARVVRGGIEAFTYAEMLFSVSQRQHRFASSFGTIALEQGVSQLERRIRLLVDETSRHGRMLIGVIAGLAISLVAIAAELRAPALYPVELRKLPPEDVTLGAQWARDAARERFPELFENTFTGTAVVSLVFNYDGSVLEAHDRIFQPGTALTGLDSYKLAMAAGAQEQDVAYGAEEGPITIGPWLSSKNPGRIDIVYAVLKWPIDSARSAARVTAAVRARYSEAFNSVPGSQEFNIITVFMNDDGTIERARKEVLTPPIRITGVDTVARFATLGLQPGEIGRAGFIPLAHGQIWYAWRARPQDEAFDVVRHRVNDFPKTDDRDNVALIKRYFPDAASHPLGAGERRWILLGRDGQVWGTGHGAQTDSLLLQGEIEARFPGIRVDEPSRGSYCLGTTPAERETLRVFCLWVAADSPIRDRAAIDPKSRPDIFLEVFLAANSGPEPSAEPLPGAGVPLPVRLSFGAAASPSAPVCQHLPTFPICRMRFIAQRMGESRVQLNVALDSPSSESEATIAINYGEARTVTLRDSESRAWRLTLRPMRLN